jgi:hypothetical protein
MVSGPIQRFMVSGQLAGADARGVSARHLLNWLRGGEVMRPFQPGDHVYPTDLPRRFVCRVMEADAVQLNGPVSQVLKLEPLEGPWPAGTWLIRLNTWVARINGPTQLRGPLRPALRLRGADGQGRGGRRGTDRERILATPPRRIAG